MEQKFTQLREVYQKLRNEHIQLLRSNGETQKKLNKAESDLLKEETTRLVSSGHVMCHVTFVGFGKVRIGSDN